LSVHITQRKYNKSYDNRLTWITQLVYYPKERAKVKIDYFYSKDVNSKNGWKNISSTWSEFVEMLKTPKVQDITVEEVKKLSKYNHIANEKLSEKELLYKSASKQKLFNLKNKGCFMAGVFTGTRRVMSEQEARTMLILDIDEVDSSIWNTLKVFNAYEYVLHTSFSHTKDKPKIRVIFPISKYIESKEEYKNIVNNFIEKNKLNVDKCSNKLNQVMFLPNKPKDGEYIFKHNKGEILNPFEYNYTVNKEQQEININESQETNVTDSVQSKINEVESPFEMDTIIGKWCKKYNIHDVIKKYLSNVYIDRQGNRYTYSEGSSNHGLIVYPDSDGNKSVFAYSNHGTDNLNTGHLHNSFDLLKIHKFNGDLGKTMDFVKKELNIVEVKKEERKKLEIMNGLDFVSNFKNHLEKHRSTVIYKTGFSQLDDNLNGGLRNYLYVLGAGSSMGKTTFVQQLADNIAHDGNSVLYFTMEQGTLELISKTLSRLSFLKDNCNSATSQQIMDNKINVKQRKNLNLVMNEYKKYSNNMNYIESDFGTNVVDIRDCIETFIQKNKKVPVVIIDYLQVLGFIDSRDSDKRAVEQNIKMLKSICKQLKCPVIVLSSLNRESYLLPLSYESFKETGGIEYTCDTLFGLQYQAVNDLSTKANEKIKNRQTLKDECKKDNRKLEFVCLKNRNGSQTFDFRLDYNPRYNYFETESKIDEDVFKKIIDI